MFLSPLVEIVGAEGDRYDDIITDGLLEPLNSEDEADDDLSD